MATKQQIRDRLAFLSAVTATELVLDIHNPGDYTRYRIMTPSGSGYSDHPYGGRSYRAGECIAYINAVLDGCEQMAPDLFNERARAYYANKNA